MHGSLSLRSIGCIRLIAVVAARRWQRTLVELGLRHAAGLSTAMEDCGLCRSEAAITQRVTAAKFTMSICRRSSTIPKPPADMARQLAFRKILTSSMKWCMGHYLSVS